MLITWVDIETTGLDPEQGRILEVALVVTDEDLKEKAAMSQVISAPPAEAVAEMDPVVLEMHVKNGLLLELEKGMGHSLALQRCLDFVHEHVGSDEVIKQTPLAGSTIPFDRNWMRVYMKSLESLFSHRSIDVSTITELAKRWSKPVYEGRPKGDKAHRALADVRESIAYLRYYRDKGFIGGAK